MGTAGRHHPVDEGAPPRHLYVHIPFCRRWCHYCDFPIVVARRPEVEPYLSALECELERLAARFGRPGEGLATVYFGGGTPTALPPRTLARILEGIAGCFGLSGAAEVTVEANPGTVDAAALEILRASGVTRLSVGVQSFQDRLLRALGRDHSAAEARSALRAARNAGFEELSLDLLFGVPGAGLEDVRADLAEAVALGPTHVSAYHLTLEGDVPMRRKLRRGRLILPDEETAASEYECIARTLSAAGYARYEVSNFARVGHRCRHNLAYWSGAAYLGAGLGAHSFVEERRWWNTRDLRAYVAALESGRSPVEGSEALDSRTRFFETVMLGLRCAEGLDLNEVERAWGRQRTMALIDRARTLKDEGWLEIAPQTVRATGRGFLVVDALVSRLAA